MIAYIVRAYTRTYQDSGQILAYVEWFDTAHKFGRTVGDPMNAHMLALYARARREGVKPTVEIWA